MRGFTTDKDLCIADENANCSLLCYILSSKVWYTGLIFISEFRSMYNHTKYFIILFIGALIVIFQAAITKPYAYQSIKRNREFNLSVNIYQNSS